jgi:hypothetical protein
VPGHFDDVVGAPEDELVHCKRSMRRCGSSEIAIRRTIL